MKHKKPLFFLLLLLSFLGVLFLEKGVWAPTEGRAEGSAGENSLFSEKGQDFWILTDVHFLAPELHDDGKAFSFIKGTAAGKDLDYQEESLEAFLAQALAKKPAAVIITGDLTLNGEKISAEKLADILAPLKKAGIKLYCIPGNHDIHDGWARKFSGDTQERTAQISPTDFKKIFPQSYEDALSTAPEDLSYSLSINRYYRFVMLDSNIYTRDDSTAQPVTRGELKESTLTWLKEQLEEAKKNKQRTIVFIHHNLLTHNPLVNKGYVLDNAATVKNLLKTYEVPVVLSGHIHAQDIMEETGLTEIVTSSYAIIDHGYGVLRLTPKQITYKRQTISVSDWAVKKIAEVGGASSPLTTHDAYLKDLFLKDGVRMVYQDLMDKGIYDQKIIDPVADLVAQVNLDYFSGNDQLTNQQTADIKAKDSYKALAKNSEFLKDYIDFALQDHNLPDQFWQKDFTD